MGKTDCSNGGFIACIPQQIEANWDREWGPRVAGFPLNIVYLFIQRSKLDADGIWGAITACYEPDLATFRETEKTREMTYFNREGGAYRVRVVLDKASGLLETFKYRGKKLLAYASGLDFDDAMLHTTLVGIEKDEPVRVLEMPAEGIPRHPTNLPMPDSGSERKIEDERTALVALITVVSPTRIKPASYQLGYRPEFFLSLSCIPIPAS